MKATQIKQKKPTATSASVEGSGTGAAKKCPMSLSPARERIEPASQLHGEGRRGASVLLRGGPASDKPRGALPRRRRAPDGRAIACVSSTAPPPDTDTLGRGGACLGEPARGLRARAWQRRRSPCLP